MYLSLRGITKRFGNLSAVDRVELDVEEDELVCFLGPSGCGKTTLLRVIAGLEIADEGNILHKGSDLSRIPARLRNFGMVFQSYSLFPNMTVERNVAYGLECHKWPKEDLRARVSEMLEMVQLSAHIHKMPTQLSGGEQQRVALARALAPKPHMLLLDEPLSALDAKVREGLRGEIRELQKTLGITTIMVTHDQDEAMEMADRIVVMNLGAIEQVGTPLELYHAPANRFVAEFIGRMNVLRVEADDQGKPSLAGSPLEIEGHTPVPGDHIGVRPESPQVVEEGDATGKMAEDTAEDRAVNRFRGEIVKTLFMGNMTLVEVRLGAQNLTVERRGQSELLGRIGAPITLHIPPPEFSILTES